MFICWHPVGVFGTIWTILRKDLHWRPYRFKRVQQLSPANMEARVDFCHWVLAKEEGWERSIIFSDEKFFVLHQAPNSQNDRCWAPHDPQEEVESNIRFDTKVMAWSALVARMALVARSTLVARLTWLPGLMRLARVAQMAWMA